jgi:hypothetical protein
MTYEERQQIIALINDMILRAGKADKSDDAFGFAQAASNAAHVLAAFETAPATEIGPVMKFDAVEEYGRTLRRAHNAEATICELHAELERLRERIKDAEKAMEPESNLVQDYYKKHPDPVDADIEPCDH